MKYDGFRLLAAKNGAKVTLRYRSGRNATSSFPDITTAISKLPARRALLAAELVALGRFTPAACASALARPSPRRSRDVDGRSGYGNLLTEGGGTMKDFHCRDAGLNCDFVARGNSNKEILDQASQHARQAHNMSVTPDLAKKVEGLIHDESSDEHRQSMSRH